MPESERSREHLRIGRLLVAHTPPDRCEETIFEIVNQLNRGATLMTSPDEREQLSRLNLIAGKRAKASAARALDYFTGCRLCRTMPGSDGPSSPSRWSSIALNASS